MKLLKTYNVPGIILGSGRGNKKRIKVSALMELISQFVRQRKWKINWKPSDNNSARFSVLSEKPIDNATLTKMPARFLCFYNLTNWLQNLYGNAYKVLKYKVVKTFITKYQDLKQHLIQCGVVTRVDK